MKCYDFKTSCDVLVIGGGIAGCAAALQVARMGKKVILLEKSIQLGGLATAGLIYIYLPICDGCGHQVSFGITEELLRNSLTLGPGEIPANWCNENMAPEPKRFRCAFSPASFMLSLEKLLLENGVDIWYDTLFCDPVMHGEHIDGVEVRNESGAGFISAGCVVDTSGSAVAARRAGIPCIEGTNFLTSWNIEYRENGHSVFGKNLNVHTITMNTFFDEENTARVMPEQKQKLFAGMSEDEILERVAWKGISGKTVSAFTQECHRILRQRYEENPEKRKEFFPVKIANMPQFRKICCVKGKYVLQTGDEKKIFEDSIGLAGDWRQPGPVWEIPYRTLLPETGADNLLFAGRCSAADGDAWEITRVIPVAAMTGQAAGLAAGKSVETHTLPGELAVESLQYDLAQHGFLFHREEIK